MADGKTLIGRLLDADGCLDRGAIHSLLPYGDEFLFVDRVTRLDEVEVEAWYRIPADAPFLRAHFRGLPVMPGTLIGEGMAQAGTVLVRYHLEDPEDKHVLALEVERMRFLEPALPGETLQFHVQLVTMSRRAARLRGSARVAQRLVGEGRVVVGIVEREVLRARMETLCPP